MAEQQPLPLEIPAPAPSGTTPPPPLFDMLGWVRAHAFRRTNDGTLQRVDSEAHLIPAEPGEAQTLALLESGRLID